MKLHILKIKQPFASYVYSGEKTFEFRENDRDFKVGDLVKFADPKTGEAFTDMRPYEITYVTENKDFEMVPIGWCIFSMRKL